MAKIFILDSTSKSITASTVLAASTIDFVTTWADTTSTTFAEGSQDGQITSDTAVTVVASPASSTKRVVKSINFFNRGTDTQTIYLNFVNSSNVRRVAQITLAAAQSWSLDDMVSSAAVTAATTASNFKNWIHNGDFSVSQRTRPGDVVGYNSGTVFKNYVASYTHDRWFVTSGATTTTTAVTTASGININQGASGIISGDVSIQSGTKTSCILQGTGSTTVSKFGIGQIIQNADALSLRNKTVTLSFSAKAYNSAGTILTKVPIIKAALLSNASATTTGAAGRFFVSAWNNYSVNPTWAAAWPAVEISGNFGTSINWTNYSITGIVPNTANLLGVLIWIETQSSLTSSDYVFVQNVQLEIGSTPTTYETLSEDAALSRCQPFFNGIYATGAKTYGQGVWTLYSTGTSQTFKLYVPFLVKMRAAPTFITPPSGCFKLQGDSLSKLVTGTYMPALTGTSATALATGLNIDIARNYPSTTSKPAAVGADLLIDAGSNTSFLAASADL